jgi:hypothetical protein
MFETHKAALHFQEEGKRVSLKGKKPFIKINPPVANNTIVAASGISK